MATGTKRAETDGALVKAAEPRPLATLDPKAMEQLVATGDLSKLSPEHRLEYYLVRCGNAGLDPAAQPFQYIVLNGKLVLYATKGCSEQLASIHGIQLQILDQKTEDGIRVVHARATAKDGRASEDIGAVPLVKAQGEQLANLLMKAVTKAKRRTILSLCGLGTLDESEVDSIPNARRVRVDPKTGDILDEGDRPYADSRPKPHASAVRPGENLNRETGEVVDSVDHAEIERMEREVAGAFGATPVDDEAPPVRDVLGIPITLGKSFPQIANARWPQFKSKRLDEMAEGAKNGQAERALRRVFAEARDICENGSGKLSEFHQEAILALEEMLRLRGAKVAGETGMGMASDLIKPVKGA